MRLCKSKQMPKQPVRQPQEKKVTEIISEEMGTNIEQLPLESPEIGAQTESTDREFKMLSRRLALKQKLLEKERQEDDSR